MRAAILAAAALACLIGLPRPVDATEGPALLFHGNYCGPGNRGPGVPPTDALDLACARHDACTPDAGLPTCACNDRLRAEAGAVSDDPRQPDDLRALAGIVSAGAGALACRPGPRPGAYGPLPPSYDPAPAIPYESYPRAIEHPESGMYGGFVD